MQLLTQITRQLYPTVCAACNQAIASRRTDLCVQCHYTLPLTDHFSHRDNEFERHFWGRIPIHFGAALFAYSPNDITQQLIHQIKYHGKTRLGLALGRLLGQQLCLSMDPKPDLIIPVPLSARRRTQRGYNQAALIAKGVSQILHKPWREEILAKVQDTESQTIKSRTQRVENMAKAFRLTNTNTILGRHILLVDDVLTTGATLESCAQLFLPYTHQISMVTLAYGK